MAHHNLKQGKLLASLLSGGQVELLSPRAVPQDSPEQAEKQAATGIYPCSNKHYNPDGKHDGLLISFKSLIVGHRLKYSCVIQPHAVCGIA